MSSIYLLNRYRYHHEIVVEKADKLENGYVVVRGW